MCSLKICSSNLGGLNDRTKTQRVFHALKSLSAEVLCLQETHIPWKDKDKLLIGGYELVVCSSQTATIRGLAIYLKQQIGGVVCTAADKWGRWAVMELKLGIMVVNIYGSNVDDANIWEDLELAASAKLLIVCGDFNIHMDAGGQKKGFWKYVGRKPKVYRAINSFKDTYGLIDVWREKKVLDPGYTYCSHPHRKMVRLDYFFSSQPTE